eukprot:Em0007g958a
MSCDAVQGTNDSSIASKLSMVNAGYFCDPYLKFFVTKSPRRAPIINRGYYVRVKAVDHLLRAFLQCFSKQHMQVISLGAGFDTSFLRLIGLHSVQDCHLIEVDFSAVIDRKLAHMKSNPILDNIFHNSSPLGSFYNLIGCDLRQLGELQMKLAECGIDNNAPTLFIAECVLTYVDVESVNKLIKWVSMSFQNSAFCTYEQIHPDDAFGHIMLEHFESQGCPLRNIQHYPTRLVHEERYTNLEGC